MSTMNAIVAKQCLWPNFVIKRLRKWIASQPNF